MSTSPTSLQDMAPPSQWAAFHGLSQYRWIAARRLTYVNTSPCRRPTYRLGLDQFPGQAPDELASHTAGASR